MKTNPSDKTKTRKAMREPKGWTKTPNWLVYLDSITPAEFRVAVAIQSLFHPEDVRAKISLTEVAKMVGLDRYYVFRLVERLEAKSVFGVDRGNGRRSVFTRIADEAPAGDLEATGDNATPDDYESRVDGESGDRLSTGFSDPEATALRTSKTIKTTSRLRDSEVGQAPQGASFLKAPIGAGPL